MSKILIIGSNSFSGSSFIKYLLLNNKYDQDQIFGMSRSENIIKPLHPALWPNKNFNFFKFHLVDDLKEIIKTIDKIKPSVIVNFAAQSMVAQSWDYPEHWFQTNCVSTIQIHNFLRNCDFLDKYIHISTPEVYGNCSGKVNEDYQFDPTTPYAVSRAATDMSLKTFFKAYKFPVITTRAANVYGPGQSLYRIIPKTIFSILKNEKLMLHGGGVSRRCFIHIDDVSNATFELIKKGNIGETYHISTDELITIRSLVEKICDEMNVDFKNYVEIGEERLGKDMIYHLDSQKLKNQTNWSANICLDDGIHETVDWLKSNFNILKNQSSEYKHLR